MTKITLPVSLTIEARFADAPIRVEPNSHLNHWVRKPEITRSIVEQVRVTALCGAQVQCRSRGNGSTAVAGAMICPLCQLRYEELP